jgi:hypothetical protein
VDLLCDKNLFLKYSDGKCEIEGKAIGKLWAERHAFEIGTFLCDMDPFDLNSKPLSKEQVKKACGDHFEKIKKQFPGAEFSIKMKKVKGEESSLIVKQRYFVDGKPSRFIYTKNFDKHYVTGIMESSPTPQTPDFGSYILKYPGCEEKPNAP